MSVAVKVDVINLKASADDIPNVDKLMITVLNRVEKTEKRRKYWLPAFPAFPKVFSKAFPFRFIKSRDCVVELTQNNDL